RRELLRRLVVVQRERRGLPQPQRSVVHADAGPPVPAGTIRQRDRLGSGVDRQDQTLTGVLTGVVVLVRGVPVADQQTVLVREVRGPVRLGLRVTEVVRAGAQTL